jgi:signal transduction histidine kinase
VTAVRHGFTGHRMSSTLLTLLGLTLVVTTLVGLLVAAVVRLRPQGGSTERTRDRMSEEAFMATAIQEAQRAVVAPPAPPVKADDKELERMVSARVAVLASGLTHELANSLTALHGYSRMIDMSSLSASDRASLEAVQEETTIMSETLDAFRRVVRRPELTKDLFELRHLVEDAVAMVERESQLKRGTIGRVGPPSAIVDGDRVLLEEAVANVVRNAVEACAETGTTGTITVSATLGPNRQGLVTVTDRGPGVIAEDRSRLFEPFFSTKPKRAGFGLAFARHIVLAHVGTITATHPDEGGLEVTIALPLAASASSVVQAR